MPEHWGRGTKHFYFQKCSGLWLKYRWDSSFLVGNSCDRSLKDLGLHRILPRVNCVPFHWWWVWSNLRQGVSLNNPQVDFTVKAGVRLRRTVGKIQGFARWCTAFACDITQSLTYSEVVGDCFPPLCVVLCSLKHILAVWLQKASSSFYSRL